jgi:membrane associated rhomboid family serine protease
MIPFSTDAPLYHKPYMTVAMIIVNVILFVLFCNGAESGQMVLVDNQGREIPVEAIRPELEKAAAAGDRESAEILSELDDMKSSRSMQEKLSVEFGRVLPWQWLTNNFMHANWEHLLGNMIFLWAFGLVVEGKVGHLAFLAIYLGIGVLYGMMLQLGALYFDPDGIALGASAAIFGLLALCIVWAPANEFSVFTGRSIFEIPIVLFGAFYVAKELLFFYLGNFRLSSELLHILGFVVGFPLGALLLKQKMVDCEGWDLFTYMSGEPGKSKKKKKKSEKTTVKTTSPVFVSSVSTTDAVKPLSTLDRQLDKVSELISRGETELAMAQFDRLETDNPGLEWRQADLYKLIQALLARKQFEQATGFLQYHTNNFDEHKTEMQIVLMRIYLNQNHLDEARALYSRTSTANLTEKQAAQMDLIRTRLRN